VFGNGACTEKFQQLPRKVKDWPVHFHGAGSGAEDAGAGSGSARLARNHKSHAHEGACDMRPLVDLGVKLGAVTFLALAPVSITLAQDSGAAAGPASPEEAAQKAVDLRQSLFRLIGYSFGPVGGMLKNKVPFDAALAAKSAQRLETLSPMIAEVFNEDTRKFQLKTKAREGIWTNKSDFQAKNDDLVKASAALTAAAKGGDKKAVMQAAAAVGKACGACHDNFRDK
jgi:cytochrome c556